LLAELKSKLENLTDSELPNAPRPIRRIFNTRADWAGPYRVNGPDLIVGYAAGYRCSWECAKGRVTEAVFCDNTRAWSGDHCVDTELVPGVLLANVPFGARSAGIVDIAPTVLDVFDVPPQVKMRGESLLRASPTGST
jgi:predicted AlkP superfamily phosphohydrolase/phosphomutase